LGSMLRLRRRAAINLGRVDPMGREKDESGQQHREGSKLLHGARRDYG